MSPERTDQNSVYYYDGSSNELGTNEWTEGTEYILVHQVDESDSISGVSYYLYDTSRNLLASATGKSFSLGSPTNLDGIYIGDGSGYAVVDAYFRWLFLRKYADPEPTVSSFGSEEEENPIHLQIISTEPETKTILYEPNLNFKVNVSWDYATQTNCSLYLDGIINNTKVDCVKGMNTIEPLNYSYTIYDWFIKCKSIYNEFSQEKQSSIKTIAIAEAKGGGEKYYNPFNQTTRSRRLILYPIRQIVYS